MTRRRSFVAVLVVVVATSIMTGIGTAATRATPHRALILAGAKVVGQSGCLACHRIGAQGNDGPGATLTTVGARLTTAQIKHALDAPRPPMPAYAALPPKQFRAVVAYLSSLRSVDDVIPVTGYLPSGSSTIPKRVVCSAAFYSTIIASFPAHRAQITTEFRRYCGGAWAP